MSGVGLSIDCRAQEMAEQKDGFLESWICDVEADIIGKSYEYLIRKFAEDGGQSAGEFYTPPEVGMEIYYPTCGSGGLLIKCELEMERGFSNPRPSGQGGRNAPAP